MEDKEKNKIVSVSSSPKGLKDVDVSGLKPIFDRVYAEICKLVQLRSFAPVLLRDFAGSGFSDELSNLVINCTIFSGKNPEFLKELTELNTELNRVISEAQKLQTLVGQYNSQMTHVASRYRTSIDDFLKIAGIPYEISIEVSGGEEATTTLRYVKAGQETEIDDVKHTLSYGEWNAVCLAFFAIEASKIDGLIVLDDPISSYDSNKRLAILLSLFGHSDGLSLRGKTVALFTHDFETLVPLIKLPIGSLNSISRGFLIMNNKGTVTTKEIKKDDITNSIICEETKAKDASLPTLIRVVHLRRFFELSKIDSLEYEYLSSLLHHDDDHKAPVKKLVDGAFQKMTTSEITEAECSISRYIGSGDFASWSAETKDPKKLIKEYGLSHSKYEKLCIARSVLGILTDEKLSILRRFIGETYHVEQQHVFEYTFDDGDSIPDYIVSMCDELISKAEESMSVA